MKLRVYSVMDKQVEAFAPPMYFRTKGEAARAFMDGLQNPQNVMGQHRADFTLCFLGWFDDNLGSFENNPVGPVRELDGATALSETYMIDPATDRTMS